MDVGRPDVPGVPASERDEPHRRRPARDGALLRREELANPPAARPVPPRACRRCGTRVAPPGAGSRGPASPGARAPRRPPSAVSRSERPSHAAAPVRCDSRRDSAQLRSTAAASTGRPSGKRASSRSSKVQTRPSAESLQAEASAGRTRPAQSSRVSPSVTCASRTSPRVAGDLHRRGVGARHRRGVRRPVRCRRYVVRKPPSTANVHGVSRSITSPGTAGQSGSLPPGPPRCGGTSAGQHRQPAEQEKGLRHSRSFPGRSETAAPVPGSVTNSPGFREGEDDESGRGTAPDPGPEAPLGPGRHRRRRHGARDRGGCRLPRGTTRCWWRPATSGAARPADPRS